MKNRRKNGKPNSFRTTALFSIFFIALYLLSGSFAYAQTGKIQIKGTVKDNVGETLIGASVIEKGTTNGVITGIDGDFALSVSADATLVITYVGFTTKEVPVKGARDFSIVLGEDDKLLDEVVVTALGIKKQTKALGYAVSEVKGDDLTIGRDGNAITALSGRVAGVDISSGSGGPSGSTRVIIRGISSLSGSNLPLYVVDGVPMDNTDMGSAGMTGGYDMGDGLSSINPDDVASISILKGASAAALYGSRASNGVVLITTKSGKGQKGLGIDVSMNVNAVHVASSFDDYQRVYGQGTEGQIPLLPSNAQTSTQSAWGAKLDPNMMAPIFNGEYKPYGNVNDNILSFFRTGVTYTNSISLSNSNDKSDFRLSVSDMRNKDIVPSSDMYRTTIMSKGGAALNDKITVEARINYTREGVNNRPALSDSPNNIGNSIIGIAPNFDQKWLANGYKDDVGRYNSWNGSKYRLNPYWVLNEMSNVSHKDRFMGHAQMNYQLTPYLMAQVRGGLDYNQFHFTDYFPKYTDGFEAGKFEETSITARENNYEAMLRFNKRFGDFDLSALIAGNIMQYELQSSKQVGLGENVDGGDYIGNFTTITHTKGTVKKQVNSVYGSVSAGYRDFLYLDFTLRNDISSTLRVENRSYVYPSVSGSFVFSEIVDLKSYGLSFGKLRASWAKVGGDTEPYKLLQTYKLLPYTVNGIPLGQNASGGTMPNYDLKPTSTYSHEFGVDLRFLNNRVNLDFNYYYQSSVDQIVNLPISSSTGFTSAMINAGEITSSGIEVSLAVTPIQIRDFEWTTTFNLATNKSKVKSLTDDIDSQQLAEARWAGAWIQAKVGERYGSIMGRSFQRNPDGEVIYNKEGMPLFGDDLVVLGNGNHDFTLGIGNTFRYKDFSLGVLFDMKFGGDLYSMSAQQANYNGTSKNTLEGRTEWYLSEEQRREANATKEDWIATGGYVGQGVVNVGTAESPIWEANTVPVDPQKYWRSVGDNTPEPFIFDASYIKLRELTLTYTVPKKVLAKTPIRGLTFTAYGRNLFILSSNLKNIDPESNYNNGNGQGFEYGSLPSRRTYGFGLNLKF